ncbi:hypothetical protein DM40_3115 [Burkholderia cenocepacia]|nr:hypothetical protein DM40_3115 [Burkholderia cenocepacia]
MSSARAHVAGNREHVSLRCTRDATRNELKQSVTKRKIPAKPGVRPCGSVFARVE